MNPIRLAVFDIAGTTVHDEHYVHHAFVSAFAAYDLTVSLSDAAEVMGLEKHDAIQSLLLKHGETEKANDSAWVERIYEQFDEEMVRFYEESPLVRAEDGAEETFELLHAMGIKVALNTGFAAKITNIIIERLGWQHVVDLWISSDEVPFGRPHPYMITTLMSRAGVRSSSEVIKIGDTVADMEEGNGVHCQMTIGVTTGNCTAAELKAAQATHIIGHLKDLIALLK